MGEGARASSRSGGGSKRKGEPIGAGGPAQPAPGLYVVATPIGNLKDVTLRALEVLAAADTIACEDTRVTAKLLARHGIRRPLAPYHEHNAGEARPKLLALLAAGGRVALVSDAGTPLVSDPGYKLVRAALEAGAAVFPLPGPSAVLAALAVAGLPTDRFLFAGFLPSKAKARADALAELAGVKATLVFYESGPRLAESLEAMAAALGDRPAAVARELTKLHEEVARGTLGGLARRYAEAGPPKGEIVVVVGPPGEAEQTAEADVDAALAQAMARMPLSEAVAAVAGTLGMPRRAVYARALALRGGA